jgi:hypothetical protein
MIIRDQTAVGWAAVKGKGLKCEAEKRLSDF